MNESEPVCWLNGEWLPFAQAKLPLYDTGLVHGDAVTEMLRTFGHRAFRLHEHLDRLFHSLEVTALNCPTSRKQLAGIVEECIERNSPMIEQTSDLGLIVFVTGGPNLTYLGHHSGIEFAPTVCVHSFELPFELWQEKYARGMELIVSEHPAIPVVSLDLTAKVRSRIHWRIADREVRASHPNASAILADAHGNLTETASGNLFAVIDNLLYTPPREKVLNGISRQVVLELAQQLGWDCREADITIEQALRADELWVSSTPSCLLPVTKFNNQPVGTGTPGDRYRQILNAWSELVGVKIDEQGR